MWRNKKSGPTVSGDGGGDGRWHFELVMMMTGGWFCAVLGWRRPTFGGSGGVVISRQSTWCMMDERCRGGGDKGWALVVAWRLCRWLGQRKRGFWHWLGWFRAFDAGEFAQVVGWCVDLVWALSNRDGVGVAEETAWLVMLGWALCLSYGCAIGWKKIFFLCSISGLCCSRTPQLCDSSPLIDIVFSVFSLFPNSPLLSCLCGPSRWKWRERLEGWR